VLPPKPLPKPSGGYRINGAIQAREVLLVGEDGARLGVRPMSEALAVARERGVDLVEINAAASPPVCKLMDYGKFKYDEKKRKRQSHRKVHAGQIKELRMRPRTDKHDLETKLNHGRQFLAEGHKLQITIVYRGREMSRMDLGMGLMNQVTARLEDVAKVERPPRLEGRSLSAVFTAKGKGDGKAKDKKVGGQAVPAHPPGQAAVPASGVAPSGLGQERQAPAQVPKVDSAGQPQTRT
jgi:translation initiation factor IF-3